MLSSAHQIQHTITASEKRFSRLSFSKFTINFVSVKLTYHSKYDMVPLPHHWTTSVQIRRLHTVWRSLCGSSSSFDALSWRGLNPIKPACHPCRPDGQLSIQPEPLNDYASIAVLVTGPTERRTRRFFPGGGQKTITSTHSAYPRRDKQAHT